MSIVRSLYSNANPSTNLSAFTAEDNLQKTWLPVQLILPVLMANQEATSRTIRVKASGQLGTTASPTFIWTARLLTSTTWSPGGIVLGTTTTATAGTTVTLAPWFLDTWITLRTLGIGATSTVVTTGEVRSPLGLASPFAATIPPSNTSPAVATVDNSLTYYLFLSATCSANNALNLINLQNMYVDFDFEN